MCFYYSGLVKLSTLWTQLSGRHLIILNFHRAAGADLRSHLLYLRRNYRILSLEQALEEFYAPQHAQKDKRDRRTPLVLTFDDGYRDNYTHGFALAQELQIPITVFLVPKYIDSGRLFWWLEGTHFIQNAQVESITINGKVYHLNDQNDRKLLELFIYNYCYWAPSVAAREAFLTEIAAALKVRKDTPLSDEGLLPLTWEQVQEMAKSDLISLQAHTMHHPVLSSLTDPEEVLHEISDCRTVLQQKLERPVTAFAFPLGRAIHIGETSRSAVEEAGYIWALTTTQGKNTVRVHPHQLRRITIDIKQHWLVTAAETAGIWGALSRFVDNLSMKFLLQKLRLTKEQEQTTHVTAQIEKLVQPLDAENVDGEEPLYPILEQGEGLSTALGEKVS